MIDPMLAYPKRPQPTRGRARRTKAAMQLPPGSAGAAGYKKAGKAKARHIGPGEMPDWSTLYAGNPLAGGGGERRPLRVVHVGPVLLRGGAEQWLIELTRFLDPGRLRIERAVATWPGAVDPQFVNGLRVPYENGVEAARRAAADCDVLMCWGVLADELLAGIRPPLCVYLAHGDGPYTRTLLDGSLRSIDHVVAVSRRVEQACAGLPTTVIYNGIDAARLARTRPRDEARAALGFAPGDFVVGYVGRLAPEKRPQLILEAIAGLPPHVKVLMVGWGPLLPELREAAERLAPGRCAFATTHHYLGDYYGAMDAFCLLGSEEGCSLAMLEAMHCSRPVIATPVGAVPELIVDRINGLVVAPTADAVREAVERLDRHPHWAAGLADEARAWADRHGHAARMAREYEDLIERLWAERPARPAANRHGHGNGHANGSPPARRRRRVVASKD